MTETETKAAELMETDELIGVNNWPLGCYVSEAIENELDAMSAREKAQSCEDRFNIAVRRVAGNSSVYAEPWGIDPAVFRAAVKMRF